MEPDGGTAGDARADAAAADTGGDAVPEGPIADGAPDAADLATPADSGAVDGALVDGAAGDGPAGDVASGDAPAVLTCRPDDPFIVLPYPASLVGYSKARDRLVVISTYTSGLPSTPPPVVHIIDPETCSDVVLPLALAPLGLSVSPDGRMAAVGHNARVTGIDLMEERITGTFVVSATTSNLQVDDRRRAHTFDPRENFGTSNWLTVDLISGQVETGATVPGSQRMALHPGGTRAYLTDGISGSEIARVDVSGPKAVAPLLGRGTRLEYRHCGRLFPSDDGKRLFTGCRFVLRSSDAVEEDLSYDGTLEGVPGVQDLAMDSGAGLLVVIPGSIYYWMAGDLNGRLRIHETRYLNLVKEVVLPPMPGATTQTPSRASRVFLRSDARRIYALVSSDGSGYGRQAILRVQP